MSPTKKVRLLYSLYLLVENDAIFIVKFILFDNLEIVDVIYNWVSAKEDERKSFLPQLIQTVQWELIR